MKQKQWFYHGPSLYQDPYCTKKKITFIQDPCLHFENLFVNDIEKSTLLLRVYVSQVDSTEA